MPSAMLQVARGSRNRVSVQDRACCFSPQLSVADCRHLAKSALQPPRDPARAEYSKTLLPQVIAKACCTPGRSSLTPPPPADKHPTAQIVHEWHVTQRLAHRPSAAGRPLRLFHAFSIHKLFYLRS